MKPAKTVNIHEAKTHLSRLIEEAVQGEPFIIAKAGKPVVRVTAIDAPQPQAIRRTGFLSGQVSVPADFDQMGADAIAAAFDGTPNDPQ
jgi:prevent-host-death family protein